MSNNSLKNTKTEEDKSFLYRNDFNTPFIFIEMPILFNSKII